MTQPIKTGLIGLGFSGQTFHLPFLTTLEDFQVTSVLSRQSNIAKQRLPNASCFSALPELLDSGVELVVITAPNEQHYPMAKAALNAGCHVLLEKPFVNSVAEGRELVQLAEQQQRILSVYHNRRWDGDFLTLQALINSGKLGEIRQFESHFDRFRPEVRQRWRETPGPGTGFLFDLGSHLIDQALVLFGRPQTMTAQVLNLRPNAEVCDYFHLVLGYPEHQVILHSSPFCASPNLRFQLHGSQGSYIKWGLDPQEERLRAGVLPSNDHWGKETPAQFGSLYIGDRYETCPTECGNYADFYRQLASAIRNGEQPPVTAKQALEVIELIELAEQSAMEQRTLTC